MNPRDFAYWLQGFFEVADTDDVKPEQIRMIKAHLALVLTKVTPTMEELKEVPDKSPTDGWQPYRTIPASPFNPNDTRIICAAHAQLPQHHTLPLTSELTITNGTDVPSATAGQTETVTKYTIAHDITTQLTC
jgi:hypothetical protein